MYVPSQEPVNQWLLFVDVLHIYFPVHPFVHELGHLFFGLYCFTFVISGSFIADCAVLALLVVKGRTMTYSC